MAKIVEFMEKYFEKYADDKRYKVLTLHLYVEHFVNEIVGYHSKSSLWKVAKIQISFREKLKFLRDQKFITKDYERVLVALSELRNEYAHNLVISEEKIEKTLESNGDLRVNLNYEIRTGGLFVETTQDLRETFKDETSKYKHLEISAIGLLAYLEHISNMYHYAKKVNETTFPKPELEEGKIKIVLETKSP